MMTMAIEREWGWRDRRAALGHAVGFIGANLVCATLTLLALHLAGALGWILPAQLAIAALVLGAACMLAGAVLLMLRAAGETPTTRLPSPLPTARDARVDGGAPRRFVAGSRTKS